MVLNTSSPFPQLSRSHNARAIAFGLLQFVAKLQRRRRGKKRKNRRRRQRVRRSRGRIGQTRMMTMRMQTGVRPGRVRTRMTMTTKKRAREMAGDLGERTCDCVCFLFGYACPPHLLASHRSVDTHAMNTSCVLSHARPPSLVPTSIFSPHPHTHTQLIAHLAHSRRTCAHIA